MEKDLKKTLKFLDATNATNLVTSKQIVPQMWNGLRRVIRKGDQPSNQGLWRKAYIAWDDNDSFDDLEKEINLLTKDYESDENISQ